MRTFLVAFAFGLLIAGTIAGAATGHRLIAAPLLIAAVVAGVKLARMWVEATAKPPTNTYRESERNYW